MSSSVRRIFVEKNPGFDIEARHLLSDLRETLGVTGITSLRLFNRYDIEGLSGDELKRARFTVFAEPNADTVYEEELCPLDGYAVFACEYLPGQYDQRADSAAQCVQLLTGGERPMVQSAKVFAVGGDLSASDTDKIKNYLINPVESRIAAMDKPATLSLPLSEPEPVCDVEGFISMSETEISDYYKSTGFAMTLADLCFCRDYFRDTERRDPTLTELKVIDTYWSDHCRHTTFFTKIDDISIEPGTLSGEIRNALQAYHNARSEVYGKRDKDVSLMDMATMGMRLLKKRGLIPDLDESPEINACSINVKINVADSVEDTVPGVPQITRPADSDCAAGDCPTVRANTVRPYYEADLDCAAGDCLSGQDQEWLVQFKNETHNHPTEIEPFGGAATCLGGAIRDPLSGRAYVHQAMRVTGCGNPLTPFNETLPGKLPQKSITTKAAAGYSSYGNQIGIPTGQVTELYDDGYVAKRMELGAVIGAGPKSNVRREVPAPGDVIVLLGGRTGRDGCGGATGSSKAHDSTSIETCGAEVQKGNPPTERNILRLFRKPEVARLIKRCNDFGAGGVSVAIGELADGLSIDLGAVPKKYDGLDGTELAISESQERMAVVLDPADLPAFIAAADAENLEAVHVATVTEQPRLKMHWQGKTIVDISREFLNTSGVTGRASAHITAPDPEKNYREAVPVALRGLSLADAFAANLARLPVCSQKGLAERFDSQIGAGTVLMPLGGQSQLTPEEAMVAKIPLERGQTDDATAMSYGFIPGVSKWSPFHGSAFAVVESLSKLLAVGANPLTARLTFQEYFERLHDDPTRWGKPAAALLGALTAQFGLGLPSIGGKDSMSGSFNELDVPPTLVSFAVTMTKASKTISATLPKGVHKLVLLPIPLDKSGQLPDYEKLREYYIELYKQITAGNITSASVVKEGGAAACVARMCFGNGLGFMFENDLTYEQLFAPLGGSLVLAADDRLVAKLENLFGADSVLSLGQTNPEGNFIFDDKTIPVNDLINIWSGTLESVFATKAQDSDNMRDIPPCTARSSAAPAIKTARPRVFIPAFPGTNCETDSARAFERAGAITEILVVKNRTAADINETIDRMAKAIANSQIIMLPGGFSGGDEPDGSGKFIATTFRNPKIAEQVMELLNNRGGLMLGICNGFQALIKLGLLPYGDIRQLKPTDPTLTFNAIGRHASRMVYTRVASTLSPWLAGCNTGDVHAVPVSHGEGRFVADNDTLDRLIAGGQVAFQYTDPDGNPAAQTEFNPNGSVCAIEGICSPDGRVLGKMGHSERVIGNDICKNVPGNKDQGIFEAGVGYFR